MIIVLDLVSAGRLCSREEVLSAPCPVSASPGLYLWWFRDTLGVPTEGCAERDGLTLLYAGISPKAPPASGVRCSSQTMRHRIRYHFQGNAEGSTLGCLLGLELRRVGSGTRRTFSAQEADLNRWMAENAFVSWIETDTPWLLETQLISAVSLPLNLDQNRSHAFHRKLSEIRSAAKARAALLPILEK